MALCWNLVHAVLWTTACLFTADVRASSCAELHTPSVVVPFGSQVAASCYIKEECSLTKDQDFHVKLYYNNILIHSNKTSQDTRIYEILITNFTDTRAVLECHVCLSDYCKVVDALEIKASYPPPVPQNLTCILNLTKPITLLCKWDPGQKMLDIPTNYTLHIEFSGSERFIYVPAPGKHFYRVPRAGITFFNTMHVYVMAVNAYGNSTSETQELWPMKTAKLDAPQIQRVGTGKFGCLEHCWRLSQTQGWITRSLLVEIRLKPMDGKVLDREQVSSRKARPTSTIEVCGLLHGMIYQSSMRVRYDTGPWSEWSHPTKATTPMKAPTGRLVTWLKLLGPPVNKHYMAQLLWKPSLQFRANSMNLSYIVSYMRTPKKKESVCVTELQHCSFQLPVGVSKVSLSAMNTAGKSSSTEVAVYRRKELDPVRYLHVLPESEESVLIEWVSPSPLITGYVLEWKASWEAISDSISFEILDKNQTSLVVSGLEPYKPYEFSVYAKYKEGIGQSSTVMAYTKEKAPSVSPKLKFREFRPYIELSWDEIPLQEKNGFITGYKVFYWDEKNNTRVIDIEGTQTSVVLKDLHPFSMYEFLLMTSTNGGSLNGSIVTMQAPVIDSFEIVLFLVPACVGLILLFIGVFACFSKNECLKKFLWPMIPDPANSSIKKWTTTDSLLDIPTFKEVKEPVLVYLSHFSLLSSSESELWKVDKKLKSSKWTYDRCKADEGHTDSSHDSRTYNSGQMNESVPYATVVFAGPYRSQPVPPPAYLRSDSTQPLLGEEEPSSPLPFKMCPKVNVSEVDHFSTCEENLKTVQIKGSLLEDFPMLRSLETQN
ncbi:granulocyte colony-stimulating factor receptor [Electrophorus electricus]|uniref:Fibronectin type-III domain-containing protein n=1 Tax=Electrophorus electricus TaxID=8005 RepID=A0A4W4HQT5_ELEEL|nr:granulocyte colony-stimulating factor receptor [Electrophorus electricus]